MTSLTAEFSSLAVYDTSLDGTETDDERIAAQITIGRCQQDADLEKVVVQRGETTETAHQVQLSPLGIHTFHGGWSPSRTRLGAGGVLSVSSTGYINRDPNARTLLLSGHLITPDTKDDDLQSVLSDVQRVRRSKIRLSFLGSAAVDRFTQALDNASVRSRGYSAVYFSSALKSVRDVWGNDLSVTSARRS